jgi:hypothetical protein
MLRETVWSSSRWEIQHHQSVPDPERFRRNEIRFCLQHLLPRFTKSGRSCCQDFGFLIVDRRAPVLSSTTARGRYLFPEIPVCWIAFVLDTVTHGTIAHAIDPRAR